MSVLTNPILRKGKAIKAVRALLNKLKNYNVNEKELLKLIQPVFKEEKLIFSEIYKHAVSLKILDYKVLSCLEKKDSPVFNCEVEIKYNFRINVKQGEGMQVLEIENISHTLNIAVIPELEIGNININGSYKPSPFFVKFLKDKADNFFFEKNSDKVTKL